MLKKSNLSVISLLACISLTGQAAPITKNNAITIKQPLSALQLRSIDEFKLKPRFNLWGYTGDSTLAKGMLMAPLYGNKTNVLYALAEGNYVRNDKSWLAGGGLGYRQIVNNNIYGGYVIADYANTSHNGFAVLSPGIELLSNTWDFNINGYIPLDNKGKLGESGFAGSTFGDYSHSHETGHEYYDDYLNQYEKVGRGFELNVARVIPHFEDAKLKLGYYHFDNSGFGSTNGIKAKLTYDLNKRTGLEIEDNYDNRKHNRFIVGVRFTLGNYSKEDVKEYGLSTRLLDPIEHDNTNTISMINKTIQDQGIKKEHDNIWYFKPGSSITGSSDESGDGTVEHPFSGFDKANYDKVDQDSDIGKIDKNPLMYFSPGAYSFSDFSVTRDGGIQNRFELPNGWGMYGRASDYKSPARGESRPKFSGGLDIAEGDSTTTLNSIYISHNTVSNTDNSALYVLNAKDVIIQNSKIEDQSTNANSAVIYADNSIINFTALNSATAGENIVFSGTTDTSDTVNCGIWAIANSIINFKGGTNSISAQGNSDGYGINAYSNAIINFEGGTNSISGQSNSDGYGINAFANSIINFEGGSNSIFGQGNYNGYGICTNSSSIINFNRGMNSIYGQGDNGYGIKAEGSTINFLKSPDAKVNITAKGGSAQYGIFAYNNSYLKDKNGNPFTSENIGNIKDYVTFKTDDSSIGKAVNWNDSITLDWPPT